MNSKPIMFNGALVQSILNGDKTATRRPVKYRYNNTELKMHSDKYGTRLIEIQKDIEGETYGRNPDGSMWRKVRGYIEPKAPYLPGDILYVREGGMIKQMIEHLHLVKILFACDSQVTDFIVSDKEYKRLSKWKDTERFLSPYWLTKETARIWLRVTDVQTERLKDISTDQIIREGIIPPPFPYYSQTDMYGIWLGNPLRYIESKNPYKVFSQLWNTTVNKKDINLYGWDADPWVWRIEFSRCERPEGGRR